MKKREKNNRKNSRRTSRGREIAGALREVLAHERGEKNLAERVVRVPETVDVRAVRRKLGMSQTVFARRFGFSPSSIRNWEQGRRQPDAPARILLMVIDREPEAVRRALKLA